jgi:hypothetical protein
VQQIEEILGSIDLTDTRPARPTPLLRLRRLRFTGEKRLRDAHLARPINYEQTSYPGMYG